MMHSLRYLVPATFAVLTACWATSREVHAQTRPAPANVMAPAPAEMAPDPDASGGAGSAMDLPPGHPPIDGTVTPGLDEPASEGAPKGTFTKMRDSVVPDPSIARGTVVVTIVDAQGNPLPDSPVALHTHRSSPGKGEVRNQMPAVTDPQGRALFSTLETGSDWVYRAVTERAQIAYSSIEFQLSQGSGKRVTIHAYEATEDIDAALVGVSIFVFVEPRDDGLAVEQMLRFNNLGSKSWMVRGLFVPLPRGYRTFHADDQALDLHAVERETGGYELRGFVRPGSLDMVMRFHMPYEGSDAARLRVHLPPRVAMLRAFSEASAGLGFQVSGLPSPIKTSGEQGRKLWVTERVVMPGEDQIETVDLTVTGVPHPGSQRWIALGATIAMVGAGFFVAQRSASAGAKTAFGREESMASTKRKILSEIADVEREYQRGEIGPKTYERQRLLLIERLARLLHTETSITGKAL